MDNLKLRLSYGVTGNNNVDDYVTIATASGPSYVVLGGSEIQGYYPNGLVNTGLIWEKVKEFDLGLDFSVLSNRINLTADFIIVCLMGRLWIGLFLLKQVKQKLLLMSVQFVIPELN